VNYQIKFNIITVTNYILKLHLKNWDRDNASLLRQFWIRRSALP